MCSADQVCIQASAHDTFEAVPAYLLGRLLFSGLQVSFSLRAQQGQDGSISRLFHCTSIGPNQLLPDLPKHLRCRVGIPVSSQEALGMDAVVRASAWQNNVLMLEMAE